MPVRLLRRAAPRKRRAPRPRRPPRRDSANCIRRRENTDRHSQGKEHSPKATRDHVRRLLGRAAFAGACVADDRRSDSQPSYGSKVARSDQQLTLRVHLQCRWREGDSLYGDALVLALRSRSDRCRVSRARCGQHGFPVRRRLGNSRCGRGCGLPEPSCRRRVGAEIRRCSHLGRRRSGCAGLRRGGQAFWT